MYFSTYIKILKKFLSIETKKAGRRSDRKYYISGYNRKEKFKLISYKEALEASRRLIYTIVKTIIQRFSPGSKENLLELEARLFNAGVQYIHVMDIFKILFGR